MQHCIGMERFNRREFITRIILLGISIGLILVVIFYWLIYALLESAFSFSHLANLHHGVWGLYLADLLPAFLGLLFWFIARRRAEQISGLEAQIKTETSKKDEIKQFTNNLIASDFRTDINFSGEDRDLSDTLKKLQSTLRHNRDSEKHIRAEERKRRFISEGLAEFGDILRINTHDLDSLSSAVISNLVNYLKANQGGFFLTDEIEGRTVIRMAASYAYGRKKYPDKILEWGEGIIGEVALEKKSLYTDKIPEGYLTITSGLGKAGPKYLLIVPLLFHDKVFGIIELASFNSFEEYMIQFVERVAESTASTISTMESNIQTTLLLKETQAQAEKLARQEEQVRQNMAELEATQLEAARQAETFISFTNTVNHTLIRAEYDTDGTLLYANTKFLKKLGYSGNKEVEGKHISMFINKKDLDWFNGIWSKLSKGGKHFEGYMKHETKHGQDLWTMATYTCVRKEDGTIEKILFLAIDTTEQKKQSLDYEGEIEAMNRLSPKAEFLPDGKLITCNELFEKTMKYTPKELALLNVFDFINTADQDHFNEIWDKVIKGDPFQGQIRMKTNYEESIWFRAIFTSIDDMYGDVEKIIFLANEISREKEMELEYRKQHDQLIRKEEEIRLFSIDLQKKLEELNEQKKRERAGLNKEIIKYRNILEKLSYPVLTVNNLGYIVFANKALEKQFEFRRKDILNARASQFFMEEECSDAAVSVFDPSRSKKTGRLKKQLLVSTSGKRFETDLNIIKTELEDEMYYTLIFMT